MTQRTAGRRSLACVPHACAVLAVLLISVSATAADVVLAKLEKQEAWVGEGVPLIITLYSPGPFSGTAAFNLPDLPTTTFLKIGRPLVGSEQVDGESYITQRHEFAIYTQRSGEIVIPAFAIRFSGKKSFTSEAEPVEGQTPELSFQSKRPPGTEQMGLVVSVSGMTCRQIWKPQTPTEVEAGDVISRILTRTASNTTAMMFPDVAVEAPSGVRIYEQSPRVEDKSERGERTAIRSDTIKYKFEKAGTFTLPEVPFVWWDPTKQSIEREVMPGLDVNVTESAFATAVPEPTANRSRPPWAALLVVAAAVLGVFLVLRKPASRWWARRQAIHNQPQSRAERALRSACRSNDLSAAYSALLAWLSAQRSRLGANTVDGSLDRDTGLRDQLDLLSRRLFSAGADSTTTWDGGQLWAAFQHFSQGLQAPTREKQTSALPTLNPELDAKSSELA